jgi:DNA-binding LacI/PurR family transcriptional regulator
LNEDPKVHPDTRARVMACIDEMDYHPSASARRMVRKAMDTIGMATLGSFARPWTDLMFQLPILGGVNDVAVENHMHMLWFSDLWSNPPLTTAPLFDGRCDGVLLLNIRQDDPSIPKLTRNGIPFVIVSDTADSPEISSVDVDNRRPAAELTSLLIENGHRKIAFIAQVRDYRWVNDRRQGFIDALAPHGLTAHDEVFLQENYSDRLDMPAAIDLLLRSPSRPTALFCVSENLALMAARALRAKGMRVPEDVSIVSFGNASSELLAELPLTCMTTPVDQLGRRSAELLLDIIHGRKTRGEKISLPVTLTERGSVARALDLNYGL